MSLCGCGVCRYVSGHVDSYSSWDSIPLPVEGGGGGGGGGEKEESGDIKEDCVFFCCS